MDGRDISLLSIVRMAAIKHGAATPRAINRRNDRALEEGGGEGAQLTSYSRNESPRGSCGLSRVRPIHRFNSPARATLKGFRSHHRTPTKTTVCIRVRDTRQCHGVLLPTRNELRITEVA